MEINSGLILPFRFYDSIEKQMRYRGCGRDWTGDDIRHREYLICYGCKLLPFQIVRSTSPSTTTNLSIVNIDTEVETDLTAYVDSDDWIIETVGEYDYITYLGKEDILNGSSCVIDTCNYYAKFSDGDYTWYSEIFKVVKSGFDSAEYRIWSKARGAFRSWDGTDLRIVKND
jgi:hypothetical protein